MIKRVERHVYTNQHSNFKELDHLTFLAKNLYNATLYTVRQHYYNYGCYLNYNAVNRLFIEQDHADYRALPAKVSQQVQKLVDKNMKSFFALIKTDLKVKQPYYLDSRRGRQVLHYDKQALSFNDRGHIKLSKTNVVIPTNIGKSAIRFVRVVPKGNHIIVEVGYNIPETSVALDKNKYLAMDLGVDNLATVVTNDDKFIVNGKPIKSINQYYNKEIGRLQSILKKHNNQNTSNRIQSLYKRRQFKINDYLHKASKHIVNYAVSNRIATIIIGHTNGWKQNTNMGSVNNQKFVSIPFNTFIHQIQYKAEKYGIRVVIQDESYTSKASFMDGDFIPTYSEDNKLKFEFSGKRVKRGLYMTANGYFLNADLNAACNILKKYLNNVGKNTTNIVVDLLEVCSTPNITKLSF